MTASRPLMLLAMGAAAACTGVDAADVPAPSGEAVFAPAPVAVAGAGEFAPLRWTDPLPVSTGAVSAVGAPSLLARGSSLILGFQGDAEGATTDVYVMLRAGDAQWSAPVNVSRSAAPASLIRLGAGPRGEVHAVWGERPNSPSQRPGAPPTALYHAVEQGGRWGAPQEIFRTPHEGLRSPQSVVVDRSGRVHVVFTARDLVTRRLTVFYARREPGGWLPAAAVAGGLDPDLALDAAGRLHLAFLEAESSGVRGSRDLNSVYTMRSEDGGQSWTDPLLVRRSGRRPAHHVRLVAIGDELHLAWLQNLSGRDIYPEAVMHAWSPDGLAWSEPTTISLGLRGVPGSLELASDLAGRLHATFQVSPAVGEGPYRPYHSTWNGEAWSLPEHVFGVEDSGRQVAIAAGARGDVYLMVDAREGPHAPGLLTGRMR